MKKMNKGFTLIELMIVVAIIGILAAVAVPNFIRYIKDSKTTEAKENLKGISDGAISFYNAEHPKDDTGAVITKQFPSDSVCVTLISGAMSCAQTPSVPKDLPEVGVKTVDSTVWLSEPWKSLKFSIAKAFYYQYHYVGDGSADGGGSSFGSLAAARLDLEGAADSCFRMTGAKNTTTGEAIVNAVIDLSESGTCPAAAEAPAI